MNLFSWVLFIFCQRHYLSSHGPSYLYIYSEQIKMMNHNTELECIIIRNSLILFKKASPLPLECISHGFWGRPTFLCDFAHNDLASSLACLLHRQRRAQPLFMLTKTLAFPKAILLHDFMCYSATGKKKKGRSFTLKVISYSINWILYHNTFLLERRIEILQGLWWGHT